jgi:hypothetical protein
MAWRLSALRAGRSLPPGRFLVLISVRGRAETTAIVRLEGLGKLKNSIYLNGNRTRDLPACRIQPQATTLPRAPVMTMVVANVFVWNCVRSFGRTHSCPCQNRLNKMFFTVFKYLVCTSQKTRCFFFI